MFLRVFIRETEMGLESLGVKKKYRFGALAPKPKRKSIPTTETTIAQLEDALRRCKGNLTYTAQVLGISREALKRRIKTLPHMKGFLESIREEFVDEAEHQLAKSVEEGYFPAVSMVLRTLGRDRGYTERGELYVEDRTTRSAAALIEAMRKGTEATPEVVDAEEYTWVVEESETTT